ncbi:MAG: thymidine phosphorylase [Candidatus Zhuqueibacterota bacterium]
MNTEQLIIKKRDRGALSEQEFRFLIEGYTGGEIPDYQMSAFLMAVFFVGMTLEETRILTSVMIESGESFSFKHQPKFVVDKHSTGGVGDKISLILAPLVAAAGVAVPMISGRGLGHTGGTLDKLEAIPGFRTNLSSYEFMAQVESIGVAMIGQTEKIVPADKKIYALRDRTGTVASIPLVVASILSKKIAEGIQALVLDVKTGNGAFFRSQEDARELARTLIAISRKFGLPATALLTAMDQPLGNAIGNWLETREAIETLQGNGPEDVSELTLALGSRMLQQANIVADHEAGVKKLTETLASGAAFNKFVAMVHAQAGDISFIEHPERYPMPDRRVIVRSKYTGYISRLDALSIGLLAMETGAGRKKMTDSIDYTSGILLKKKVGDSVEKGEALAEIYAADSGTEASWQEKFLAAVTISETCPATPAVIIAEIKENGQ